MKLGEVRKGEEGKEGEDTFLSSLKSLAVVMIRSMSESPKKESVDIEDYRSSGHNLSLTDNKWRVV